MPNYVFGSIHPVGTIDENMSPVPPLAFQGEVKDRLLMPKKAQIPFITNQSVCSFPDSPNGLLTYLYNLSDDHWYNSNDPTDIV